MLLLGANGSGKTSVLEAISLLSLGRGLRARNLQEIKANNLTSQGWQASFALKEQDNLSIRYNVGRERLNNKSLAGRKICFLNANIISNSELVRMIKVLWLTPQMNLIFIGGAIDRRKWLDRMVYTCFPDHVIYILRYNHYIKSRLAILKSYPIDYTLLKLIEQQIAPLALKIELRRQEVISVISEQIKNIIFYELDGERLCNLKLAIKSQVVNLSPDHDLAQDDIFEPLILAEMMKARDNDRKKGYSSFGPHRTDLLVEDSQGTRASLCSTGEQKSMLLIMIIAHAAVMSAKSDNTVLLLDDLTAHLDLNRQRFLLKNLLKLKLQLFISTTEDSCKDLILQFNNDLGVKCLG